ncbi:MAG: pyrroline-5-carboxylate reductase [Wenzhouxiangella sp.]|nr:MAG: pyrroline-5-carboxylate reductase [Wenzhouxiangella sp.]
MKNTPIAFIGGGNMARALIGGLLQAGHPAESITVADPGDKARQGAAADFGVRVTDSNVAAVEAAPVVVLAVKPQIMAGVLTELAPILASDTLLISVAAGVTLGRLEQDLGADQSLVRAMPNTPALYGAGMTGLVANAAVDRTGRSLAGEILATAGQIVWLDDESLMDVVTAVSGSGPAYFFALAEQLALAGERAGLAPTVAAQLARQTAFGAGLMLVESGLPAGELRMRVTSPGGTTQAALESLGKDGFERMVESAVEAAVRRGRELGES